MVEDGTAAQRLAGLLPRPVRVVPADGEWRLPPTPTLRIDGPSDQAERVLAAARAILPAPAVPAPAVPALTGGPDADLRVVLGVALPDEGYRLDVTPGGVTIEAAAVEGAVRALHTLDRLLPADSWRRARPSSGPGAVPPVAACCRIEDAPAFAWRGVLLDVSRHFLPKGDLLKHLRVLASYGINRVQLHLTDDQGWRVESRAYPRLHEVGSWRPATRTGRPRDHGPDGVPDDGTPHGGYYSLDDLREIGCYATDLGIEMVPEIDLPGHTAAMIAAYPELGTAASRVSPAVERGWGVHDALIAPTAATMAVVEAVLDEVVEALPGRWLHLGGDEARFEQWLADPDVVAELSAQGGSGGAGLTERDVFAAFLDRMAAYCVSRGRRMLVWDDAFAVQQHVLRAAPERVVDTSAVVTAWRGLPVARQAAAAGQDVVLAPMMPTYLDYASSDSPDEPLAIGGPVTLDDVLSWTPLPGEWSEAERAHVLGVQAQLWTEYVPHGRALDYLLYPRVLGIAEAAWTGGPSASGGPASGRERVAGQLPRLAAAGVEYRPLDGPHPWQRGGTGPRAWHPLGSMQHVIEVHERAAEEGRTPTHDDYA